MQQQPTYDWKRFWYPQGSQIQTDNSGYLIDPMSKWSKYAKSKLVELEKLVNIPCLVLMGEPGIGKSQEIENLRRYTEGIADDNCDILWLNLRSCTDLRADLFQDEQFVNWKKGTHRLYLFLDSLDEGLAESNFLAKQLLDILEKKTYRNKLSKLYIRLACRDNAFPKFLEEGFLSLWGEGYAAYKLSHLSLTDVAIAATCEGIEAHSFIHEIIHKNLTSFTIKPITLNFLFKLYKANEQFSENQTLADLYLEGCRALCDEYPEHPRRPGINGNLELDERLLLAARVATVTIFAGRAAIWVGRYGKQSAEKDVDYQEIAIGYEYVNKRKLEAKGVAIKEVLGTGLFSGYSSQRIGWAHRTYTEFLAAWYLVEREIPLHQLETFFLSPEDPDHRLIPQLHETAAWLSSMRADFRELITRTDPNVILRSDIPLNASIRESIITNLLKQYEAGKIFDRGGNKYRFYEKLRHPEIEKQLRPYLRDSSKHIDARSLAIDISEVCQVTQLEDELLDITLDSSQPIDLRVNAARAISSIGSIDTKRKLKSLATEQLLDDEDDQLEGYALMAAWPTCLSVAKLFQSLTTPKHRNFVGAYQIFLECEVVQNLKTSDLPYALDWLKKQGARHFSHPFAELGDHLLFRAWQHFEVPEIQDGFTKVALTQWREHQSIIVCNTELEDEFESLLSKEPQKRRLLLTKAVSLMAKAGDNPFLLTITPTDKVLTTDDFFYALTNLKSSEDEKAQQIWAKLIQNCFNWQDVKQIDAIIETAKSNKILHALFEANLDSIELDSDKAQEQKASYLKLQALEQATKNELLDPPPRERVIHRLENFEAGNISTWWRITRELMLTPTSRGYGGYEPLDVTKLPGWKEASTDTRRRIVDAAKQYIENQNNISTERIAQNKVDYSAFSGAQAFHLLSQQEPESLAHFTSGIWQKWVSVIIAAPSTNQPDNCYLEVVKYAYLNAPMETLDILIKLIDIQNEKYERLNVLSLFNMCWDRQLKSSLLEKAQDPKLKPNCLAQLIEALLEHESAQARELAKSIISWPFPLTEENQKKRFVTARALIEQESVWSWSFIWPLIQQDVAFGKKLLESIANGSPFGKYLDLNEKQMADLYIWLVKQYPYEEDLDQSQDDDYELSSRASIVQLREGVLSQLRKRGTLQTCVEIQRLIYELPDIAWLGKILIDAQENMRRQTWKPPTPKQLLQIILDQDKRLVQNGHQLVDVLIESLQRLNKDMQGETPASVDLWDKYRPKDENALSDYIKRFLDKDLKARGIIVNREVELRRGYGNNPGERTDIHVDAIIKHPKSKLYDSITVIIEVKGCWHREVKTAIKTQLVDRYLADNACSHGLYLVGWFDCPQWDNQDSRYKNTPKMNLNEAKQYFEQQAKDLTSTTLNVRSYVLNTALR